jgi:NADPH:quinone reductase-like Zn-dependent oxidoreductase
MFPSIYSYGASSITGQFIIQVAQYSGLEVIAVASERTKTLMQNLGAKHVITRNGRFNEQIVAEIRSIGGDNILKGIKLVGPETSNHCMSTLSTTSPVLIAPLSFLPKYAVAPAHVSVQTLR